ncbi:hypothetical protein HYU92_00265 [Candidatus Curtissbacteria bacterium]|nr:hypothetical protein [Candidatus Curtissbacteria bacterium]
MKELFTNPADIFKKPLERILNPVKFPQDLTEILNFSTDRNDCDDKEKGGDCKDDGARQTP